LKVIHGLPSNAGDQQFASQSSARALVQFAHYAFSECLAFAGMAGANPARATMTYPSRHRPGASLPSWHGE